MFESTHRSPLALTMFAAALLCIDFAAMMILASTNTAYSTIPPWIGVGLARGNVIVGVFWLGVGTGHLLKRGCVALALGVALPVSLTYVITPAQDQADRLLMYWRIVLPTVVAALPLLSLRPLRYQLSAATPLTTNTSRTRAKTQFSLLTLMALVTIVGVFLAILELLKIVFGDPSSLSEIIFLAIAIWLPVVNLWTGDSFPTAVEGCLPLALIAAAIIAGTLFDSLLPSLMSTIIAGVVTFHFCVSVRCAGLRLHGIRE